MLGRLTDWSRVISSGARKTVNKNLVALKNPDTKDVFMVTTAQL